jgi:hypothetical protein
VRARTECKKESCANFRAELSGGEHRITKEDGPYGGAVYEVDDHTRYVIAAAPTREEADAKAGHMGSGAKVFAVRPYWTRPAKEWIAADPESWRK